MPQGTDTQVFCYDDLARLTWAGSSGTPTCSGAPTPSDTGSLAGTGGAQYSASYSYDSLNRLTSSPLGSYTYGDAAHVDAATAIGAAWSASYDAAGNLTCRAATAATTCSGSSPTGAQLAYDNEGQLAAWQNAPGNNPTANASYLYDGEGNRVEQVATSNGATTTTAYVGSLEEIATTGSTTTTTAYYGGLATSVNGALSYTLSDGLGSVSESVNATTGTVTASQLYAPYGGVRYASGTLPGSRRFTGQRSDAATSGLDYYGARYYDPAAGQFTSADTTLAGGLNRYAYVAGNPETRTDPSGHTAQECDIGLCGGEGLNIDGDDSNQGGNPDGQSLGGGGGASPSASTNDTDLSAFTDPVLDNMTFTAEPSEAGATEETETVQGFHEQEEQHAHPTEQSDHTNTSSQGDGKHSGSSDQPSETGHSQAGSQGTPNANTTNQSTTTLFHGTTSQSANNILKNGVDREFYTTPNPQLAADFGGQRVTLDDPYVTVLRLDLPDSAIQSLKDSGALIVNPLFRVDGPDSEYVFSTPDAWNELSRLGRWSIFVTNAP